MSLTELLQSGKRNQMKRTRTILTALTAGLFLLCGCDSGSDPRDTVYEDMKEAYEKADLMSSNIGLVTKTEEGDSITYGEFGSGVIIGKEDDMYYALTAAHVVSHENSELLVFTVNTEMKNEEIPGIENMTVLKPEVYDSMYKAEVLFSSDRDDLAVIRFACPEDLSAMEIAEDDLNKDDRIMCIGNPQNEWFAISYGKVISGIEKFGEFLDYQSNAMKHTAYMNVGSSGGAAVNEEMKLAGITPGAYFSPDGKKFISGVLIPVSEIRLCLDAWDRQAEF